MTRKPHFGGVQEFTLRNASCREGCSTERAKHGLKDTYWVPAKAKKRKDMVPTNSPMTATVCPRVVGGSIRRSLRIGPSTGALVGASVFMV